MTANAHLCLRRLPTAITDDTDEQMSRSWPASLPQRCAVSRPNSINRRLTRTEISRGTGEYHRTAGSSSVPAASCITRFIVRRISNLHRVQKKMTYSLS